MFSLGRDKCSSWALFSPAIVWMCAFGLRTYLDEGGRCHCNNIIALDGACDSYSLMRPQGGRLITEHSGSGWNEWKMTTDGVVSEMNQPKGFHRWRLVMKINKSPLASTTHPHAGFLSNFPSLSYGWLSRSGSWSCRRVGQTVCIV